MGAKIPTAVRELRPHVIFRFLEWLWDNSGKVSPMLAALVVAVNFLRRYWQGLEWLDRLTLIVIGVFTLGAIVLFAKFLVGKVRKPMKLASPVIDSAPDKTTVTAPRRLGYYVEPARHRQLIVKRDSPTILPRCV